jgi:hypothetical protein
MSVMSYSILIYIVLIIVIMLECPEIIWNYDDLKIEIISCGIIIALMIFMFTNYFMN